MTPKAASTGDALVSNTLIELLIFLTFVFIIVLKEKESEAQAGREAIARAEQVRKLEAVANAPIEEIARALEERKSRELIGPGSFPKLWSELVPRSLLERELSYDDLKRQRDELAEQKAALQDQIRGRGGRDLPPCWSTQGQIEVLFTAIVQDQGISLVPAWPESRTSDASKLSAGGYTNELIPASKFKERTAPLFRLSVQGGCRHYVAIESRATMLQPYRDAVDAIQKRFYTR